ncbi:MAG TPA: Ig-like domain-containing protein, partial [Gemmatimonadales bacterium]|nr:Ig-like domain-containing protein [Gemmatimonadales bacterium]
MAVAAAVFAACSDRVGPGASRAGSLGISPRYESAAAGVVDVSAIRVRMLSTFDDRVALDTVIAFPPGDDSVSLAFTVPLEQPGEEFQLYLRLIGPAGDTVFTSGPDIVRPASGGATAPVVEPLLTYVGVGANAAAVVIVSSDTTLFFGGAVVLQATALDSSQSPIPGTPIEWISLDPLVVVVPAADSGWVIAGTQRGTARIVARSPRGQADTVRVVSQPVPGAINPESGSGQTAPGGGMVPQSLVARVTAADGLGVRGVWVRFAVTAGGGALGADSVLTDSTGRAAVSFQIGQTGAQTVQATTAALTGQVATFTATVQAGPPAAIAIVAGDGQSAIAGSNVAVAPRVSVTDTAGRPVSGATVTFVVTVGGGNVTGGTPATDANGEAAAAGWTLGAAAGANALQASVGALTATFSATGLPGPASLLPLVGGDAQSDTAGATMAQPLVVRATDANGNGAPGVPIAWTATAGALNDDTVVTDATGLAQVTWTLPTVAGTPGATARIAGTAVTRGFTATVLPATARRVAFLLQPSTVALGGVIAPPVEVEVTDQFGNRRTTDAGRSITLAIGTNPGGATLGGTPTRSTTGGIASFADLTVSASGNGYTLVVTSAGLVPDTSAAFNVQAPPGQTFWTNAAGGNWSAGANWSTGVAPGPTDTAYITLDGTYTVTLDVNPTITGLVLGAASGSQTLTGTGRTVTLGGAAAVQSNGVLSLSGGSVTGAGSLVNQGQVTLLDVPVGVAVTNEGMLRLRGTTALNGAVSNLAGAELRVEGFSVNGAVTTAAGWTNAGTLVLSHGGAGGGQSATLTVNGTLVNAIGAVLRAEVG